MAQAKRGSFGTINMILAFLVIAGFMYWLNENTVETGVAVAEEEPTIDMVPVALFAQSPMMYSGTEIVLTGVEVVNNIGSQAFFFALPDGGTYLTRLAPALIVGGLVALPGDRGSLTGTVRMMTDSIFQAWTDEGIFVGGLSTRRDEVGAVESFFSARAADLTETSPPAPAPTGS